MATLLIDGTPRTVLLGENTALAALSAAAAASSAATVAATSTSLSARLNFFSVPGGEYALTFGNAGGPIFAGITTAQGLWDFSGVRTLPVNSPGGTVTATLSGEATRSPFALQAFDATTRALLFGLQPDGTLVATVAVTEVITARGTATDLNTRLSRGLTDAGSPKTGTQNLGRLVGLRSGLTYLKNGGSALVHIILDGDSWWDSKAYGTTDAITRFDAESGLTNAGPGWIGLASGVAGGTAYHGTARNNITVSRTGTWTDLFHSADVSPGTVQNFPGYDAVQSGADLSVYTAAGSTIGNCTSLTLFCGKGGGIEQSWDGGATYASVTVAAGSGSTTSTVTTSPTASFTGSITGTTLTVSGVTGTITPEMTLAGAGVLGGTKIVSGAGTTWTVSVNHASAIGPVAMTGKSNTLKLRCTNGTVIAGLFGLTAASGVVFSNLSCSGSTAAQHASVQANADYKAMMTALPGDAFAALIQLGLNDTKAGTANATIVTNVGAVAAGYRAVYTGLPPCDVAILCQPNTPLSVQDTLAPLLRSWAEDNGAAFLDWQTYFGTPASSGDYAGYSRDYTSGSASTALPLLEVSTAYRHPSPASGLTGASKSAALTGAGVIASALSNVLLSPLRGY